MHQPKPVANHQRLDRGGAIPTDMAEVRVVRAEQPGVSGNVHDEQAVRLEDSGRPLHYTGVILQVFQDV